MKHTSRLFLLYIVLSTLFMASSFPTGKYLIQSAKVPPFLLGGSRFLLAGALLLFFCYWRFGKKKMLPTLHGSSLHGMDTVFIMGLLQTAGAMGFLNLSFKTLSASLSSIIFFTNPLWLALMAHLFLKEYLSRYKFSALFVGIAGVVICMGLNGQLDKYGIMYALLGALCWASCTVIARKTALDDSSIVTVSAWQMLWGGIILLLIAIVFNEKTGSINWGLWAILWFVWLVFPASIGSFSLWFIALKMGGATRTSCFLFLVPLFSTIFSVITLGDALKASFVVGGCLILLSLILINKK